MSENLKKLISNDMKKFETIIVDFYLDIGKRSNRNLKLMKIFAYFKIYEQLTQKQLRKLTNFSLSTISSALQLLIQINLLTREFITNTHTNLYTFNKNGAIFSYYSINDYLQIQEKIVSFIDGKKEELSALLNRYPKEANFLIRRLNSLQNFLEIRITSLKKEKTNRYLEEDISDLIEENSAIEYPNELLNIEEEIVNYLVSIEAFMKDDPIINKILSYLITRMKLDQEKLISLTGYSRSTISRNLSFYSEQKYIGITRKEYLKPRNYFINSISMYLISTVLMIDSNIHSWKPKLLEILKELEHLPVDKRTINDVALLKSKIKEILEEIKDLESEDNLLKENLNLLEKFLNKK